MSMTADSGQTARVRAHFRAASATWGQRYAAAPTRMSDLDLVLRRALTLQMLQRLLNVAREPLHLLDVGCGTGELLATLPVGRVRLHGIDLAAEMAAAARRRAPDAQIEVGDAAQLEWATASMDVVTCLGVLEYLPDAREALAALRRVLRPGGWLIASFPNRSSVARRLTRLGDRCRAALVPRAAGAPAGPGYAHRQWRPAEARRLLAGNGFEVVATRFYTYGCWGRLGRLAAMRAVARRVSEYAIPAALARWAACSFLVTARRPADGAEGGA
jgi:ubiquinone/menaquinone biosynthesis C-methylase UbiE